MKKDDLRLSAMIKAQDQSGNIVIVGCPFDFARKRAISKGGEELGPCCLRRFFHKVGPLYNSEYQIDVTQVSVSDMGNIEPTAEERQTPQKVIGRITDEILSILKSGKIPFAFGGSKESCLGSARAFYQTFPSGNLVLIGGLPFLKRPFDGDKLTSDNILTILEKEFPGRQTLFGSHAKYFPKTSANKITHISHGEIYEFPQQNLESKLGFSTRPVHKLSQVLSEETDYHITLSVEGIDGFRGCRDLPSHGILPEEMIEVFYWMGQQKGIRSVDITEFNPSCEDFESSNLLVNLLYYFVMGFSKRQH